MGREDPARTKSTPEEGASGGSADRTPTNPGQDALTEPTEGHVDVDAATQAHRGGPSETLAGAGGPAAEKPGGIIAGAGLTDHDQPVEGGRDNEDADDGWHGQGDGRTSFGA